jgi:hypothetical protein
MNPLREQREYAVLEAARKERAAWAELERASKPHPRDELTVRASRERWQAAAHALVGALRAFHPSGERLRRSPDE